MIGKRGGFVVLAVLGLLLMVGSVQVSEPQTEYSHCVHTAQYTEPAAEFNYSEMSHDAQRVFDSARNSSPECVRFTDETRVPPEFTYSEHGSSADGGLYFIHYRNETYTLSTSLGSTDWVDGYRQDVARLGVLALSLGVLGLVIVSYYAMKEAE